MTRANLNGPAVSVDRSLVMTKAECLAAIFAIAFAIIYAPTMDYNWTMATYHPIQGIWQFGRAPPLGGGSPAMHWYGFVIAAALGAGVVTALAALIPDKLLDRVPWRSLTWIVTICSIIYIGYVLLPYAMKTQGTFSRFCQGRQKRCCGT